MDRLLIVIGVLVLVGAAVAYRRLRGRPQTSLPSRVDPAQLGLDASHGTTAVVAFSGPLCHACQQWGSELHSAGIPYRKIDVLHEAGLAREKFDERAEFFHGHPIAAIDFANLGFGGGTDNRVHGNLTPDTASSHVSDGLRTLRT